MGPAAKVRSAEAAWAQHNYEAVAEGVGLTLRISQSDGTHPVGRGIGPALEASDVLAVLQCSGDAPEASRGARCVLAGHLLEIGGKAKAGEGETLARSTLQDGRAWKKFQAICEAQGGMRTPPVAPHTHTIVSSGTADRGCGQPQARAHRQTRRRAAGSRRGPDAARENGPDGRSGPAARHNSRANAGRAGLCARVRAQQPHVS